MMRDTNKPIMVTGFGEINFGSQYRQGNRVYSSEGIAMAITANPVGNTGAKLLISNEEEI